MTYRELLEKYKSGELSNEEKKKLEADLEKQEAISEYLTEKLEEELRLEESKMFEKNSDSEGQNGELERLVRRSIRRAFCKMGLGICAVIMAMVLFVQFALPPLVDHMYYDPGEQIQVMSRQEDYCRVTDRMSRDLSIYSELMLPGKKKDSVNSVPLGYGKYAITVNNSVTYRDEERNGIGGQIIRGTLNLYDPDYLMQPFPSLFACFQLDEETGETYREQLERQEKEDATTWYYMSLNDAKEAIEECRDDKIYRAYVTLERRMSFDEMQALMDKLTNEEIPVRDDTWMGVCVSDSNYGMELMGHEKNSYQNGLVLTPKEREKYPNLSLFDEEDETEWDTLEEKQQDEKIMTEHFISMINYISDQSDFLKMTGEASGRYLGNDGFRMQKDQLESAAKYVEEHGLTYYGFVCAIGKKEMQKLQEVPGILAVTVEKQLN